MNNRKDKRKKPKTKRINAEDPTSNCYCYNNPVKKKMEHGFYPNFLEEDDEIHGD